MRLDLDNPERGVRECPKCRFTMERLRNASVIRSDEGYLLDHGTGWDADDHFLSSYLLGSLSRFFWRHFVQPLGARTLGQWRARRYRRILRDYPETLICPHCGHLIKRR